MPNKDPLEQQAEEFIKGMRGWREEHQHISLYEIEKELNRRLATLQAETLEALAQQSTVDDWVSNPEQPRPLCVHCGEPLQSKGKRKRTLQTTEGEDIELKRTYASCPKCQTGLFPPR